MQELYLFLQKNRLEAGCDEAGRGCLAGPVVAAAVILDPKKVILGLNDLVLGSITFQINPLTSLE